MSNTIYENNYNEIIEKHNIDLSRLKRDYITNPLKRGEKPHKEDLEYLYIECNLSYKEISKQYITNKTEVSVQRYIKFYNIIKSKELIREKTIQTNLKKYGVEYSAQNKDIYEKVKQTNLKKYGVQCSLQNVAVKEKAKQTNLERYGVENVLQNKEIREKQIQTNLERYGVEYAQQATEVKEKAKQTNLERYGVEYVAQNKEIREKQIQTNLKKYGGVAPICSEKIKDKIKQTNLEKYGVENVLQNKEIREKQIQTNLKKYGVEYVAQNKEIREKQIQTNLERYGGVAPICSEKIKDKIKQNLLNNYGIEHISQKHIPLGTLDILNDKDKLIQCFEDNNTKSRRIIADKLNVSLSVIDTRLKDYTLSDDYRLYNTSYYEEELVNNIREFYDGEILTSQRVLNGKEIDIYIPEFNIGIEFNGNFWHSEAKLLEKTDKPQLYHYEKSMVAKNKGIFLIHIFEYEYNRSKDKYIDYIRRLMGLVEEISIDDCIINRVAENEYVSFIGDNSLQGQDNSQIQLGLYYNDELVEVMSFTEIGNDEYELVNHTVKQGKNVINGINKLFNHFINTYKPNKVTGYNNIHNQRPDIYGRLNFKYSYTTEPNYVCIDNNKLYDCGREVWEWFK